jgi:hypothetical protein
MRFLWGKAEILYVYMRHVKFVCFKTLKQTLQTRFKKRNTRCKDMNLTSLRKQETLCRVSETDTPNVNNRPWLRRQSNTWLKLTLATFHLHGTCDVTSLCLNGDIIRPHVALYMNNTASKNSYYVTWNYIHYIDTEVGDGWGTQERNIKVAFRTASMKLCSPNSLRKRKYCEASANVPGYRTGLRVLNWWACDTHWRQQI